MKKHLLTLIALLLITGAFTSVLISKFVRKFEAEKDIIDTILGIGYKFDELAFDDRVKKTESDALSVSTIKVTNQFLNPLRLKADFHVNEGVGSTIEVLSDDMGDLFIQLELDFEYSYTTNDDPAHINKGNGILYLISHFFKYTQKFPLTSFSIEHKVELKFSYGSHKLHIADKRVSGIIDQIFADENLDDFNVKISSQILNKIENEFDRIEKNRGKNILLSGDKEFSHLNCASSLAPFFAPNGIIYYYEGSVKNHEEEEDMHIEAFKDFDYNMESSQLFIHKKTILNLFKLNYDGKLFKLTNKELNELNIPDFKTLNVQWLSNYAPEIILTHDRQENFFIEYTSDDVKYSEHQGVLDYTFYFVSYNDASVLLKFKASFVFNFRVKTVKSEEEKLSINFEIDGGETIRLDKLTLLSETFGKFRKNKFSGFIDKLVNSLFKNTNYSLFNRDENFSDLISSYNTVDELHQGFILSRKLPNRQFLGNNDEY